MKGLLFGCPSLLLNRFCSALISSLLLCSLARVPRGKGSKKRVDHTVNINKTRVRLGKGSAYPARRPIFRRQGCESIRGKTGTVAPSLIRTSPVSPEVESGPAKTMTCPHISLPITLAFLHPIFESPCLAGFFLSLPPLLVPSLVGHGRSNPPPPLSLIFRVCHWMPLRYQNTSPSPNLYFMPFWPSHGSLRPLSSLGSDQQDPL